MPNKLGLPEGREMFAGSGFDGHCTCEGEHYGLCANCLGEGRFLTLTELEEWKRAVVEERRKIIAFGIAFGFRENFAIRQAQEADASWWEGLGRELKYKREERERRSVWLRARVEKAEAERDAVVREMTAWAQKAEKAEAERDESRFWHEGDAAIYEAEKVAKEKAEAEVSRLREAIKTADPIAWQEGFKDGAKFKGEELKVARKEAIQMTITSCCEACEVCDEEDEKCLSYIRMSALAEKEG